MDNYEQLKVKDENVDENTVVSINEPKSTKSDFRKKKYSVVKIIWSALKADNFKPQPQVERKFTVPVPKYTILTICLLVFLSIIIFTFKSFVNLALLIPITLIFVVIAIPTLLIVFFIEFNTRKSIKTLNVLLMFILGMFTYVVLKSISDKIFVKLINENYIDAFGIPVVWSILLCFLVFLFCNILKVSKMPECFLIAIGFSVGYSVAQSMYIGFSNLFISTQITIAGGNGTISLPIIINETEDLAQSYSKMLESGFMNYVFMPFLYANMAVIVGGVVSSQLVARSEKKPMPKSMYFLILLNIIIYAIARLETNFLYYNLILRAFSMLTAILLTNRILNICLNKECNNES